MVQRRRIRSWVLAFALLAGLMVCSTAAQAAKVVGMSPQGAVGSVEEVRQIVLRFDAPAVPAGDPRAPAPATLLCQAVAGGAASTPAGSGRWADSQRWLYDLREPLPASTRCTLKIAPGFAPLSGALEGANEWRFATGAPRVVAVQPYEGARIEEDQHFLLRFNGPADAAGATRRAWCEVEGLGERIGVKLIDGAPRDVLLRARAREWSRWPAANLLLLACQRPFPAMAGVRLVWGPATGSSDTQRFEWKVRERFAVEFSCERENAQSACLPLRPMTLRFTAPVPRALAQQVRLVPAAGAPIAPKKLADDGNGTVNDVQFAAPLPENARLQLTLPAGLVDETGRALSNAGSFPLAVATGGMPPLAKFAGAPFGILEAPSRADEPALLPLTLRQVQADLIGASTGGSVRVRRLDASTPDLTLLQWIGRIERFHERDISAKEAGLPQAQWTERVSETDDRGRTRFVQRERNVQTRTLSLLAGDSAARATALPQPVAGAASAAAAARPTEVIGLPLAGGGYHVVEIESRILGAALLASRAPMYVRTGALVTPIAVHFKRGRSSSLAWVTTLERARPVAGARVVVNDCRGQPLWSGLTGADGIARIERGFDEEYGGGDDEPTAGRKATPCLTDNGLFVSARAPSAQATASPAPAGVGSPGRGGSTRAEDLAFVFSRWHKGIEPWRFDIPTAAGTTPDRRAHTVFDRTLLRAGEVVSMKHFVRDETERGLSVAAPETLPDKLVFTHQGSGAETVLPLAWPRGARSAESRWLIPKTAALGAYDVALQRGDERGDERANKRLSSGSLRIEAFRVPLVDARLAGPADDAIAATEIAFNAQINAMVGGPMAAAPVVLSALLRPAPPSFAQHPDFRFAPPRAVRTDGEENAQGDDSDARLVADKLQAKTDAQGAARLVIKGLPALPGPAEITAELGFDDPNGEVQTVTQRVRLWPAAVVVGLRAPSWAGSKGAARFTALVVDTRGKPMAGRAVEVIGRLHQTMSTRTRIVGGFYAYDNKRSVRELGVLCSGNSDAQGRLNCDVEPKASGEIELVARARDDAGRTAEAAASVWVTGEGELWFEQDNDDRIDVLPEQRSVEPGQTARLQVRMPFRNATALVTVEREGVIDALVVTLSGRNPIIEVPIPKTATDAAASADLRASPAGAPPRASPAAAWAPNVNIGVLVLRGRLREAPWWSIFTWGWREPGAWWQAFRHEGRDHQAPTALVDLAKPTFKFGVAALEVGLAAQRLDVAVSADKPSDAAYAVRDTVKATVRVTQGGKPLAGAEVAFAAVDEGLLALMPNRSWQALEALYAPRPWGVETSTAQGELIGRRHYGRKALPPGGGGGRNPTRELFDTLLLWKGTVVLDASGTARIDVPLNDSLTRFKLVAIADDGAGKFGTGSTSVRVSQDLQMLSGLPPLAREGDRVDAAFTLRNTTDRAMSVTTTLSGSSDGKAPLIDGPPTQTVQLAAGAASEVKWTVAVPEGATRIEWTAEAAEAGRASMASSTGGTGGTSGTSSTGPAGKAATAEPARDRLKIVQAVAPVVPQRVWQATLRQLDSAAATSPLPLAEPAGALPGRGRVLATLQPRLAMGGPGGGLPGVRRYFETYPYTCLEQKVSRAIGLRDAAAWQALGGEVAGYLDRDGMASYFPPQPGDAPRGSDKLTAYLIAAAHETGYRWPDAAREQMLSGLAAFVEGRIERRFNAPRADLDVRKLAALEALSRYRRVVPRMLGSLSFTQASMATWPTAALLDAWRVLQRVDAAPDRAARLSAVQQLVRSRLTEGGTTLAFSTETQDDWWWLMDGADANAARLLLAALDTAAWKDDVPRLMTGLLARQQRGAWRTTTANVWGSLAVERFSQQLEAVAPGGRTTVSLAANNAAVDWAATPAGATLALPFVAGDFNARHTGAGRPWLTIQALAAVPLSAPLAAGYRITRSVTAVQRKRPDAFSRGDVLRVRLEVEAAADMAWVVLSDPVPAGATLLGAELGRDSAIATRGEQRSGSAWLAFEERGVEAWRSYFEWLPRGRHVVEYTLRLNASGRFGLPPTRVEAMYAPDSFGEAPNTAIEVKP